MKLHVLGSSSRGNGYLLYNDSEALILEAGLHLMKVKKALDFNISMVQGCLVSHRHDDHARYIEEYMNAGIKVLAPGDVFNKKHHRGFAIQHGKGYALGNFKVVPFDLEHDVPCMGYLIDHPDSGRILFITDAYVCPYKFTGLNHIIMEANYADEILEQNILDGIEHPAKRQRLLFSHMELQTTIATLMAQDLSKVQNIMLIHLSDNNASERMFVDEVVSATGKLIACAREGLIVDLSVF